MQLIIYVHHQCSSLLYVTEPTELTNAIKHVKEGIEIYSKCTLNQVATN